MISPKRLDSMERMANQVIRREGKLTYVCICARLAHALQDMVNEIREMKGNATGCIEVVRGGQTEPELPLSYPTNCLGCLNVKFPHDANCVEGDG